jgi:HD-GYP domain-containing protein (c-di-GMP phosphodiesterase class II)
MLLNKKIIRFVCTLLGMMIISAAAFAQTSQDALVQKYLEKANAEFDDGNIEGAYKNINATLNFCVTNGGIIPANVLVITRSIYTQRLKQIQRKYNENAYIDIKTNLEEKFPAVNTTELSKLLKQIAADVAATEKAENKKQQKDFLDSIKSSTSSTNDAIAELGNKMVDQGEQMMRQTEETNKNISKMIDENVRSSEKTQRSITIIFIVVVIIVVVILLIVGLILLIMRISVKQSQMQQAQYAEAFRLLAQNQSQTNQLMIGGIAGLYGSDGLKLAGSSTWSQEALPEPEDTEEEKESLRELAVKCEELGTKIDQTTGRKNNSKNVSELVYKLAVKLGVRQHDAMVYFCASMVYDAGFLSFEPELLQAEQLTEEERKKIARHIDMAEDHLQFVPKKYWEVFYNAAKFHHENEDGSGYTGVKGDDIPKIAKIIRVADSYNALSSKRAFRGGMDKDSAVEKLEQESYLYDKDVLNALKEII